MKAYKIIGPKTDEHYKYTYSNEDKNAVFRIDGNRSKNFRLPESLSNSLQITCQFLIIQVKLLQDDSPTFTVTIKDKNNNKLNISISTVGRLRPSTSLQTSAMTVLKIPKGFWYNICFDLKTLVSELWNENTYSLLDSIEITPSCLIRYIFASDNRINPAANGTDLPRGFSYTHQLASRTICFPNENKPKKSKIPCRASQKPQSAPILPKPVASTSTNRTSATKEIDRLFGLEEDESDDENAFDGVPASEFVVKSSLPEGEEDLLELVYIESLGCYYCPSNQQYYQFEN